MLTVVTGGARSGKSTLATDLAARSGCHVVCVATATAGDHEMATRIAHHRAQRPAQWRTIEEPDDLALACRAAGNDACVVIDCLSMWTMHCFERTDEEIVASATAHAAFARARTAPTIVVANEVGSGIVPGDVDSRRYRDLLGRVNATWSRAAHQAFLVVAGRVVALADPSAISP